MEKQVYLYVCACMYSRRMRVLALLIYTAPASLPNPSHPMKQTKRTAEGGVRRTGPERGAFPLPYPLSTNHGRHSPYQQIQQKKHYKKIDKTITAKNQHWKRPRRDPRGQSRGSATSSLFVYVYARACVSFRFGSLFFLGGGRGAKGAGCRFLHLYYSPCSEVMAMATLETWSEASALTMVSAARMRPVSPSILSQ